MPKEKIRMQTEKGEEVRGKIWIDEKPNNLEKILIGTRHVIGNLLFYTEFININIKTNRTEEGYEHKIITNPRLPVNQHFPFIEEIKKQMEKFLESNAKMNEGHYNATLPYHEEFDPFGLRIRLWGYIRNCFYQYK